MNIATKLVIGTLAVGIWTTGAYADYEYNKVPAGDKQYADCMTFANKNYEGGDAPSPISGQNKAQAWCTCMWNETPDNFRGGLGKLADSPQGAAINKTCEKYANWES